MEEIQETRDTAKKWPLEGMGKHVDTRQMGKAGIQPWSHIPTPQELELEFQTSDLFAVFDSNHTAHLNNRKEYDRDPCTFYMPGTLYGHIGTRIPET